MKRTLAWLLLAAAAPAPAADLVEAYRAAQRYDANYLSAEAQYRAAQEDAPIALSQLLPHVDSSASSGRATQGYSGLPAQSGSADSVNLTFRQPVLRAQNYIDYQTARLTARQASDQLEMARQDLVQRLGQAWFGVMQARDQLAIVRAQRLALTEQLAQAQRNFDLGVATVTDRNEAQAKLDQVRAQEIGAASDLANARRALEKVVGQKIEPDSILNRNLRLSTLDPGPINQWLASADKDNPQLKSALKDEEAARLQVDRSRAGHLPTLDMVGTWTNNRGSVIPEGVAKSESLALQLSIPIFSGGGTQATVRKSLAQLDKSKAQADEARRAAELATQTAYYGVKDGLSRVGALIQAVNSAWSTLDATRKGMEAGLRTNADLLNAQQQYYASLKDLAAARYDVMQNYLKLKSSAGALREEDVALLNNLIHRAVASN